MTDRRASQRTSWPLNTEDRTPVGVVGFIGRRPGRGRFDLDLRVPGPIASVSTRHCILLSLPGFAASLAALRRCGLMSMLSEHRLHFLPSPPLSTLSLNNREAELKHQRGTIVNNARVGLNQECRKDRNTKRQHVQRGGVA